LKLWENIKKAFNNWCAKMEKSNRETFGGETPDCCKLNQKRSDKSR
jgi:hypothetical protein